ncbi:MAG: diaminopimelate epimerase [Parasphingopyxis sp.]|nr:diaminopimelate epimerase [Sphingomonadales bacterium]
MRFRFHKMHGLGNDFAVIDARDEPVELDRRAITALADRRSGIGFDQLILLERDAGADARMSIYNADGGEAEACGNAARCVALLLGGEISLATGDRVIRLGPADGAIRVEMGEPKFGWDEIPLAHALDTASLPVAWEELENPFAVNVGNPHLVFFVDDPATVDLGRIGPEIEKDPLFPNRINVGVASVTGPQSLRLLVWERGAGLTRACGTGACAAAVAAIERKLVEAPVTVVLPGGPLEIDWRPGSSIVMTGPASHVFTGEIDWDEAL